MYPLTKENEMHWLLKAALLWFASALPIVYLFVKWSKEEDQKEDATPFATNMAAVMILCAGPIAWWPLIKVFIKSLGRRPQ
jgi:hypothetical protein